MNSDLPLDCALFQLSPGRTRCELFVSGEGKTEKLASGFIKPFVSHLKVAEEQMSNAVHLIKLDIGKRKKAATWFSKGTVERFVRFVSTPEVLELVNTFDEEMSQLEGARKIYSLGTEDKFADESEIKPAAAPDATKKELLRAIDVRLIALKQDLATASARTITVGFNLHSVSELLLFADHFGAFRLSEACNKFLSLHQRRPELISHEHSLLSAAINSQWKSFDDAYVRSSSGSDMSIDQPEVEQTGRLRLTTSDCREAQMCSLNTHRKRQVVGESIASISEQLKPDPHCSIEKLTKIDFPAPSAASAEPVQLPGGGSRRLSVQDRINLFECKQKEQSASSKIANGSFCGTVLSKVAGAKGEHRRNPSDVSVEKSVLRRWSGTSDMSIDLSSNNNINDAKETGSTAGTETSSANSLQTISRNAGIESNVLIEALESCSLPSPRNSLIATSRTFSSSQYNDRKFPNGETQNRDSTYREGIASISISHSRTNGFSNYRVGSGSKEPAACQTNSWSVPEELVKEEMISQIPSRAPVLALSTEPNQSSFFAQPTDQKAADGVTVKTQATSIIKFKAYTSKREDAVEKSKDALDSQIQLKDSMSNVEDASAKVGSLNSQTHGSTSFEEQGPIQTNLAAPQVLENGVSSEIKQNFASQGLKFLSKAHVTGQRKFQGRRGGIVPIEERSAPEFTNSKFKGGMEISPSPSLEKSRTARSVKGNHELNDVLQVNADELERLFAEHKLSIHGDQVASTQRSKIFVDHATKSIEDFPAHSPKKMPEKSLLRNVSSNAVDFNPKLLLRIDDNFDLSDAKIDMIVNYTPDDSKGKLYGKYMQKRDAKLRKECGSKRSQKEAKMKEMHDSLEHSQAELKARFAGFSDGQNLTDVLRRAEKMRSFNFRLTSKSKDQVSKSVTGNRDDDEEELSESSTGNHTQRSLPIKTSSSTSRTSVSPTSRESVKSSNSGSLRHRVQSENPSAQSVANLFNLKDQNMKPSTVVIKATTRRKLRSFSRSKSCIKDAETVNEGGPCLSNSMRTSSASPNQLKDHSSLNFKENFNNFEIRGDLKQYLKKDNGAYHRPGAIMARFGTSTIPEKLKNKEKAEETVSGYEELPDMFNNDEDSNRASADENNLVTDHHIHCVGGKNRPSQEYEEPGSEYCKVRTLFNSDDSTMNASKIDSRNVHGSREASPESWNSQVHHSLPYTQDTSDIDASVGSLTDSSASWNSHLLNQMMDSEATRMRKKWGNAQIPVIAASSYHHHTKM